jgi:hypothetical protein
MMSRSKRMRLEVNVVRMNETEIQKNTLVEKVKGYLDVNRRFVCIAMDVRE